MPNSKMVSTSISRTGATRRRVLDAAERLLRDGGTEFSMRDLAAEAGVSFATPFNHFGSKAAIMHALSAQRIDAMAERFGQSEPGDDAATRVFVAVEVAAAVMLAEPAVNRAVIGTLGTATGEPGKVYPRSRALWAQALEGCGGLDPDLAELARSTLPDQLAVAFRGVLSFWTAGEIGDAELVRRARAAAAGLLLGFLAPPRRASALAHLDPTHGQHPAPDAGRRSDPTG